MGLDKNIIFYDINEKIIVKRIRADVPFQSVSFSTDGHTIAIGANGMGAIMVYDLRKSSKEVYKYCTGHKNTVNSLQFMNKVSQSAAQRRQTKELDAKKEKDPKTPNQPDIEKKEKEKA